MSLREQLQSLDYDCHAHETRPGLKELGVEMVPYGVAARNIDESACSERIVLNGPGPNCVKAPFGAQGMHTALLSLCPSARRELSQREGFDRELLIDVRGFGSPVGAGASADVGATLHLLPRGPAANGHLRGVLERIGEVPRALQQDVVLREMRV